jgi:hypothetical protein
VLFQVEVATEALAAVRASVRLLLLVCVHVKCEIVNLQMHSSTFISDKF